MPPSRSRGHCSAREQFRTPYRPASSSSSSYTLQSHQSNKRASTTSDSTHHKNNSNNNMRQTQTPRTHPSQSLAPALHFSDLTRAFWSRRVRFPAERNLTLGRIISCLGLKRSGGDGRGAVRFAHVQVRELADAVALAASNLPTDADNFVDVASQPEVLSGVVDDLLGRFGGRVWGPEGRREWLLREGEDGMYARELRWGDVDDRPALKEYARLWILVKGINAIMYDKYKKSGPGSKSRSLRASTAGNAHDLPRYNRAFWSHEVKAKSPSLNVVDLVDTLGLERRRTRRSTAGLHTSGDSEELEVAVVAIADALSKDEASLIDIATIPDNLHPKVDALLLQFGGKLWAEESGRALVYSKLHDRIALRHHLRVWIIVQAFNSFKSSKSAKYKTESISPSQGVGRNFDGDREKSWSFDDDETVRQPQPGPTRISLLRGLRQQKAHKLLILDKNKMPARTFAESMRSHISGSNRFERSPNHQGHDDLDLGKKSPFVPVVTPVTAPPFDEQGWSSPMSLDDPYEPDHTLQLKTPQGATKEVDEDNILVKREVPERAMSSIPLAPFSDRSSPMDLEKHVEVKSEEMAGEEITIKREVSERPAQVVKVPSLQPRMTDEDTPLDSEKFIGDNIEQMAGDSPALENPTASAKNDQGTFISRADSNDTSTVLSGALSETTVVEQYVATPGSGPTEPTTLPTGPEEPLSIVVKTKGRGKKKSSVTEKKKSSVTKTTEKVDSSIEIPVVETTEPPENRRSTRRKFVKTYNEAILSGRAKHTPTKYLEKHHKVVLHDPATTASAHKEALASRKRPASKLSNDETVAEQHPAKKQKSTVTPGQALTAAFLEYFQSDNKNLVQESSLLDAIERALTALSSNLSTSSSFLAIITAWLAFRRTIMSVQQRTTTITDFAVSSGHVKINRSRLLTELRLARDTFVAVQGDEVRDNETVMAEVLGKVQGSVKERKEVREMVSEGLRACEERLFGLGEELGSGRWVLMG